MGKCGWSSARRVGFWCTLALRFPPVLFGVNPNLPIDQYLHTSFNQEEGHALPPIELLAQTDDGYLWLATSGKDLIRFDGMRFVNWSPPAGQSLPWTRIGSLRPARHGGLWIGASSGIWRLDHGRLVSYPTTGKLTCGITLSMVEDRSGQLWFLYGCPNRNTLGMVAKNGSLRVFTPRDGLPDDQISSIFEDSQGQLWLGTLKGICQWTPGQQAVCSHGGDFTAWGIAENRGRLVFEDVHRNQVFQYSGGRAEPLAPRVPDSVLSPESLLADRDGNLWIGTMGQGLLRFRKGQVDRFTSKEGLSDNFVTDITEDREGDIWVATVRGIDRIRDPKAQLFDMRNGLSSDLATAVYGAADGTVWVGTTNGLNRLDGEHFVPQSAGLPHRAVYSLYEDARGRLWVGTADGLAVQLGDRFVEVRTEGGQRLDSIVRLGGDAAGIVTVLHDKRGLLTIRDGVAHPVPGGPDPAQVNSLLVARSGELWLGMLGGGVTVVRNGVSRHYDTRDGVAAGAVRTLYQDPEGVIWAGATQGLSRFRDSRWTAWTAREGLPREEVQSIVEDGIGGLWLLTTSSVVRLALDDLNRPMNSLPILQYGLADGLRLTAGSARPRLTRARDGRLWVCTDDGVAVIDPARVRRNLVPPTVVIEQLLADGRELDLAAPGEKAFRAHNFQIAYTGISLMAPDRVRFQYRMFGVDPGWTDAGDRRTVNYVNLTPGHYHFQVRATNNDQVPNDTGDTVQLRVTPYFYETPWFGAICVGLVMLSVWTAHRIRVRRVVAEMEILAAERARFSRELHDTLLQGFAGVVLQLGAAVRQLETDPEKSRQRIGKALDKADESIREARQLVEACGFRPSKTAASRTPCEPPSTKCFPVYPSTSSSM